ncbi:LAXTG-anchored chaplin ChpC [Streptomyces sannanensis]|uniref:LAXTG-anchored chaplin ChpC n=1 Tax=Streptomyces sannanensis TaxID=285536 RepID=A0ABP6SKK3_9ACTN
MRQVTRKGLITMAAASGVIAVTGGYAQAYADANASGTTTNSPGVLSGNAVQVPVHIPVNACGNSVNVIGLLNPAFGNRCANVSQAQSGGSAVTGGGATAGSQVTGSPGVVSGNNIQAPVDVPVNACGNSVNVIGLGNPAFGQNCHNGSTSTSVTPPVTTTPPPVTTTPPPGGTTPQPPGRTHVPPGGKNPETPSSPSDEKPHSQPPARPSVPNQPPGSLAETGAGDMLGVAVPAGAMMLLGGTVLYRRARSSV